MPRVAVDSYHPGLEPHEHKYRPGAMNEWTNEELRWWVRLLERRSEMRVDEAKRDKDLADAKNYRRALQARSDSV